MIKEKQIKEMRKDLIEIFDEEYEKRRIITADFTAIKMTAKGYVKQSEGEWIVSGMFDDFLKCSSCGYQQPWQTAIEYKYCPNCGAKKKGDKEE